MSKQLDILSFQIFVQLKHPNIPFDKKNQQNYIQSLKAVILQLSRNSAFTGM